MIKELQVSKTRITMIRKNDTMENLKTNIYRAVFHNSTEGYVIIQRHGSEEFTILDINPVAYRVGNWQNLKPEEIIGKNILDVFESVHKQELLKLYNKALDSREIVKPGKLECQSSNCSCENFDVSLIPLSDDFLLISYTNNISRVEAEEKYKLLKTELKQLNYITSHDLQGQLSIVSGFMELLSERYKGKLDTDADDFIAFAVEGVTCIQRQVTDLLLYSKLSIQDISFEPTDCEVIIGLVMNKLKNAIEESKTEITHDTLPMVMANDVQLVRLFQNLIGNAIKFQDNLPPKIHVGVVQKNGEWLFSIQDNGIGIEAQHAERIFNIFQRLHVNGKYSGTGIGLAICKKIVECHHGGRIWVESEPGRGSTFYFTIPYQGQKDQ